MSKLKVITFLIVVLIPVSTIGQSLIGVYGGINGSSFYDKDLYHYEATYESKPTYIFGIYYKEREHKYVNMTWSVDYLYRTVEIDASYGGLAYSTSRNLDVELSSINLRMLPELKLGNKYPVFFNLGPYLGWIMNSYYHNTGSHWQMPDISESWDRYESAKEEFNGLDFGVSFSLGIEIPFNDNFELLVDGNYSIGLSNIASGDIGSHGEINSKNVYFTCGLVYKFKSFSLTKSIMEI